MAIPTPLDKLVLSCLERCEKPEQAVLYYSNLQTVILAGPLAIRLNAWSLEDPFWSRYLYEDDGLTFMNSLSLWSGENPEHDWEYFACSGGKRRPNVELRVDNLLSPGGTDIDKYARSKSCGRSKNTTVLPFQEGWCGVDTLFLELLKRFGKIHLKLHSKTGFVYTASNKLGSAVVAPIELGKGLYASESNIAELRKKIGEVLRFPKPKMFRSSAFGTLRISPLFIRWERDGQVSLVSDLTNSAEYTLPCQS